MADLGALGWPPQISKPQTIGQISERISEERMRDLLCSLCYYASSAYHTEAVHTLLRADYPDADFSAILDEFRKRIEELEQRAREKNFEQTPAPIPASSINTVSICGIPYALTMVPTVREVEHDDELRLLWGQICHSKHSIRYAQSNCQRESRTILHEIIHGVVDELKIRKIADKHGNHLESAVCQLSTGIAEALESMGIHVSQIIKGERT